MLHRVKRPNTTWFSSIWIFEPIHAGLHLSQGSVNSLGLQEWDGIAYFGDLEFLILALDGMKIISLAGYYVKGTRIIYLCIFGRLV